MVYGVSQCSPHIPGSYYNIFLIFGFKIWLQTTKSSHFQLFFLATLKHSFKLVCRSFLINSCRNALALRGSRDCSLPETNSSRASSLGLLLSSSPLPTCVYLFPFCFLKPLLWWTWFLNQRDLDLEHLCQDESPWCSSPDRGPSSQMTASSLKLIEWNSQFMHPLPLTPHSAYSFLLFPTCTNDCPFYLPITCYCFPLPSVGPLP